MGQERPLLAPPGNVSARPPPSPDRYYGVEPSLPRPSPYGVERARVRTNSPAYVAPCGSLNPIGAPFHHQRPPPARPP
eukprot:857423-Heterocapsa_arctica.AAC.1